MDSENSDAAFERRLRAALEPRPHVDFDAWQSRHAEATAYLNPIVTKYQQRRRRNLMRLSSAIAALFLIAVIVGVFSVSPQPSFAETIKELDNAKNVTWTNTVYSRVYSRDGQRSWLHASTLKGAYLHPGLYRLTYYDDQGNASWVNIIDSRRGKTLSLNMNKKQIDPRGGPQYQASYHPRGRFGGIAEILESKPVELVGQRRVDGRLANVIRYRREKMPDKERSNLDIWIDAESKQLVGLHDPGADYFDIETDPDRNAPAEKEISKGVLLGSIISDIKFDVDLDADLFDFTPPANFTVVERPPLPKITEADLIEWLRVTAEFNDGTFIDSMLSRLHEKQNIAAKKPLSEQTEVERRYLDLWMKQALVNRHSFPIADFAEEMTQSETFRYVGKGVRLGDGDRIVCWYKLKRTDTYRAIFGDLTVREVTPKDLPLPVEN